MSVQIIALGGGGFSMEPDNPLLDQYLLAQCRPGRRPRVCFLPQASGESPAYIINFYQAFQKLDCRASHLSLFQPPTADLAGFLADQDLIFVGGGNTRSLLALWREWGLDAILPAVAREGVVLAGISAGAICWFEQGLTDSIPGRLTVLPCLGYLSGSATPHYDGEAGRRPQYHACIAAGDLLPGYAFDDGAAGHFVDGALLRCVASRPAARACFVTRDGAAAAETPLPTTYLV
ncbi:MAG: peptidase E [Anaerolineae bacterium]|nr:peptidase E [Anaerolineae bacterium]